MKRIYTQWTPVGGTVIADMLRLGVPANKKWTLVDIRPYQNDLGRFAIIVVINASPRHVIPAAPVGAVYTYNEELPGGTELLIQANNIEGSMTAFAINVTIDEHE